MADLLSWLKDKLGMSEALKSYQVDVPVPKRLPTAEDVQFAKQNDATYGDPVAGLVAPGGMVSQYRSRNELFRDADTRREGRNVPPPQPLDERTADQLYNNWLATRSNALAALGFDPRQMSISGPSVPPMNLNIAGMYSPAQDRIRSFTDPAITPLHESIHRGFQMLRQAGMLPAAPFGYVKDEETLTRAAISDTYGPVEKDGAGRAGVRQVEEGEQYLAKGGDKYIKQLQSAAANLIAQRRPRGPR